MHIVHMTLKYGSCCMTGEMAGYSHRSLRPYDRNKDNPRQWLIDYYGQRVGETLANDYWTRYNDKIYGKGTTEEEAWANCLLGLQADSNNYTYKGAQVRTFWFVDYGRDGEHFEAETLRQLVMKLPGVVHMGQHVNSNTKNLLDCYMAVFQNENGRDEDEEEEPEYDDNDEYA